MSYSVVLAIIPALVLAAALTTANASQTSRSEAENRVEGTTIRYTWTYGPQGPVMGVMHEHVFNRDGTVRWRVLEGPQKGKEAIEKKYSAVKVADDVYAVSYLAASGHTLTVILNFRNLKLVGFASSEHTWYPVEGTFRVVQSPR